MIVREYEENIPLCSRENFVTSAAAWEHFVDLI